MKAIIVFSATKHKNNDEETITFLDKQILIVQYLILIPYTHPQKLIYLSHCPFQWYPTHPTLILSTFPYTKRYNGRSKLVFSNTYTLHLLWSIDPCIVIRKGTLLFRVYSPYLYHWKFSEGGLGLYLCGIILLPIQTSNVRYVRCEN